MMGGMGRVERPLDILAPCSADDLAAIQLTEAPDQLRACTDDISAIIRPYPRGIRSSCNEPDEPIDKGISIYTGQYLNVDCAGTETRIHATISLYTGAALHDTERSKNINTDERERRVTWV